MAYTKQGFASGGTLYASQLNAMDDQIALNEEKIEDKLNADQLQTAVDTALAQAKESGEFKGDPGLQGIQGIPGEPGQDGASVAPLYAESLEELNASGDTEKLYVLPDGMIYAWQLVTTEAGPGYTNLADPASADWYEGYRINSGGGPVNTSGIVTGSVVTNFVGPIYNGDVIRVHGINLTQSGHMSNPYKPDKTLTGDGSSLLATWVAGNTSCVTGGTATDSGGQVIIGSKTEMQGGYFRFSGVLNTTSADVIITINEEITEGGGTVTEYKWASTGHAFVPADYEDRIIDLEDDVAELKTKVNSIDASASGAVVVPSYWQEAVDTKAEAVKALQTAGGKDCVCFAWASDTHIPDNDTGRTDNIGKVMAAMLDACDIPFAVITGDINTRASYPTEAEFLAVQAEVPKHLSPLWGTERLLPALGNHDGCWGDSTAYYRHQQSPEELWQIYFREHALDFRRVFSDDGSYYYIDNIPQKTRFVVLNSQYGGEYAEDSNGLAVNNRFGTSCYGQEQLDWLADTALDMPEEYGAIIFTHVPPKAVNGATAPYTVDYAQLVGIINAYCNKTTYSGSYTGIAGWTSNSVSVDFTAAKGEIIAMFAGHIHQDTIDTETLACPLITIIAAGAPVNAGEQPERTTGTATETSFDVVTVNKKAREIYCTRVGAGDDRSYTY